LIIVKQKEDKGTDQRNSNSNQRDRSRNEIERNHNRGNISSKGEDYHRSFTSKNDGKLRRDGTRDDRYDDTRRGGNQRYEDDRYHHRRERSDSGHRSADTYNKPFHRGSPRDESFHPNGDRKYSASDVDDRTEKSEKKDFRCELTEWPPSFQKDGSAFTFDARSAMFYEPLSDFFYDPKSKLYYGNKKCAYYRHDEQKKPPFVEVQKLTTKEIEDHQREDTGGVAQEKLMLRTSKLVSSKPKIEIKFKTKKVKSSSLSSSGTDQPATVSVVSKVKQEQIANIGKWKDKQAELKKDEGLSKPKIRITTKGEPICMICKRKFPNLAKLRLHERGSELHKKNLLRFQENKKKPAQETEADAVGTKRKLSETPASTGVAYDGQLHLLETGTSQVYTDRAEKRRQFHGVDLCAPALPSLLRQLDTEADTKDDFPTATNVPGNDLLNENNIGLQMFNKINGNKNSNSNRRSVDTTNDHLRKEWARIEAMAQKPAGGRRQK